MRQICVMPKIASFRDLVVWQKAMILAERCYRLSKELPRDDQWVLGHQIRKSCVSVPSNIAEGFGRYYTPEYVHHLRFSKGSVNELQTQIELAKKLQILSDAETTAIIADAEEIGRMLHGLAPYLPSPFSLTVWPWRRRSCRTGTRAQWPRDTPQESGRVPRTPQRARAARIAAGGRSSSCRRPAGTGVRGE